MASPSNNRSSNEQHWKPSGLTRSKGLFDLRQGRPPSESSDDSASTSTGEGSKDFEYGLEYDTMSDNRQPSGSNARTTAERSGLGISMGGEGDQSPQQSGVNSRRGTPRGPREPSGNHPTSSSRSRHSANEPPRSLRRRGVHQSTDVNDNMVPAPLALGNRQLPIPEALRLALPSLDLSGNRVQAAARAQQQVMAALSTSLSSLQNGLQDLNSSDGRLLASLQDRLQHVIPSDAERKFPLPQRAPEDIGKSNEELIEDMLKGLQTKQADSLSREPVTEEETIAKAEAAEKRRLKNKKKNEGRKAKKAALGMKVGGEGDGDDEGDRDGDVDVEKEDLETPVVEAGTFAKHTSTNTINTNGGGNGGTVSINRSNMPSRLDLCLTSTSPTLDSPTPKLRNHRQLSKISTPTLRETFSNTGFQVASPRPQPPQQSVSSLRTTTSARTALYTSQDFILEGDLDSQPTIFKSFAVSQPITHPPPAYPPPSTYGYSIHSKPGTVETRILRVQNERPNNVKRPSLYYFEDERVSIALSVSAKIISINAGKNTCEHGINCEHRCENCRNKWFAYYENATMVTTLTPEERKRIIDGNRSLRTIKTELENLSENGMISNEAYEAVMQNLPLETSLNASSRSEQSSTPVPVSVSRSASIADAPPAYNTPTPPSLPARQNSRQELGRVIALYAYTGEDSGDCAFLPQDEIIVYERPNAEWSLGMNTRTRKEGLFPNTYAVPKGHGSALPFHGAPQTSDQKSQQQYGGYQGQSQSQSYSQPGPSNPYVSNNDAPRQPTKGAETGKKIGKKLGNAALFGAGATVGSGIVRAIF